MDIDWNELFLTWYMWLSSLNSALAGPIRDLSDGAGLPLLSAFLFGVLATTAPCQISTNLGAFAFLARQPSERAATWRATLAYMAGRVLVYTIIGVGVLLAGQGLMSAAGQYLDLPRKLIGPAMILMGLAVLKVFKTGFLARRFSNAPEEQMARGEVATQLRRMPVLQNPGRRPAEARMQPVLALSGAASGASGASGEPAGSPGRTSYGADQAHRHGKTSATSAASAPGPRASFLLGMGFSLAFCPTMVILFFGATMSLASRSNEGFLLPALFGLGAVLPLAMLVTLALTSAEWTSRVRRGMRRANRPLRWLGGVVLIIIGLHDTLIYWFL